MINPLLTEIHCLECGQVLAADDFMSAACPVCGSPWLDARYDYAEVARRWPQALQTGERTLWRYADLLPVQRTFPEISMGEGNTPLSRLVQYERSYQHQGKIYVKDERAQPTNSFKDRQAVVTVMALQQQGIKEMVLASTGNAAVAYAAYTARAGIKLWLFLTGLVPAEKMREAAIYGCEVVKVSGTYDETKKVAAEFAARKGIHFDRGAKAVPGKESMKTMAFEIAEQLGLAEHPDVPDKWLAPDWYIQAVSGGIGPLGVWKGFEELLHMGLIDKMPRLGIVQAAGCSPMVQAFHAGKEQADPVTPQTLVHVLATGAPGFSYVQLREACLSNGGMMVAVEDGEAFTAMRKAASKGGMSVEPATAVAFAGLEKMLEDGTIAPHETVVLNASGHTFPAESHILGDQYQQYILDLQVDEAAIPQTAGLGSALQNLDEQVTTIVIVDDNPNDRRLIRRLLQSYKRYRVYEARTGEEGLQVIHDRQPDLIVIDLTLPDTDGFVLLETLKANPDTATIPAVVVSAKDLTVSDRKLLEKHAESVWQKGGLDTRQLVQHVVDTLGHEPLEVIHALDERAHVPDNSAALQEMPYQHTIVVIDDNPDDLRLARRILTSGDDRYNLIEASNGRDGLKAIYKYHPDLIILDLELPDVDGYSIIETLQKDAHLVDIPLIIYSAHDVPEAERVNLKDRIRKVVRKSTLSRRQLLDTVADELI